MSQGEPEKSKCSPSASGVSKGLVPPGHLDRRASAGHDDDVELVACRLHDSTGDDLGLIELPVGWELGPDLLVDDRDPARARRGTRPLFFATLTHRRAREGAARARRRAG